MKKSLWDESTDIVLENLKSIGKYAHESAKNTKPFRGVKIPDKQRIMNYLRITPEIEKEFRQSFGNEDYDKYVLDIQNLISKGYGNGR